MAPSLVKLLAGVGSVIVIAGAAVFLFPTDGPDTLRGKRLDEQRVADLDQIAAALNCYWTKKEQAGLPPGLPALRAAYDAVEPNAMWTVFCALERLTDPLTGEPYEYRPLDKGTYELCAEFAEARGPPEATGKIPFPPGPEWNHPAGYHCFLRSAVVVSLLLIEPKPPEEE